MTLLSRGRAAALAAALAVPVFAESPAAPPSAAPRPADHVFIVMLDGTRPDALRLAHAPNVHALAAAGTQFLQARTTYPSQTRVAFVTLSTGCHPGHHGIMGGSEYRDAEFKGVPLGDDDPIAAQAQVLCPTFFEEATAAGLTSVYVAMKGYELVGAKGATTVVNGKKTVDPSLFATRYENAVGNSDELALAAKIELGRQLSKQALDLVREKKPNLLILNLASADYAGHSFGPSHPHYREAIEAMDGLLGQLVAEVDKLGIRDRTAFVISADHGFSDVDVKRMVVAPTKDATLAPLTEKGIEHVVANTGGASMGLYLKDKKKVKDVVSILRAQPWCESIYCEDKTARCDDALSHLDSYAPGRSPDLMIDLDDDATMGRLQGGAHGSHRENDMRIPLIFSGAGIASGKVEGKANIADVAPTVLRLLGITPTRLRPDGRVLEEVLAERRNP